MNTRHPPGCHAQKRAKSRYGLRMFPFQLDALADDIQAGKTLAKIEQSNSRWICLINAGGVPMIAVYSCVCRRIMTFLPLASNEGKQLIGGVEL